MDLLQKILTKVYEPRLKTTTQLTFLKRLSRSLSNGYPLIEALETMKWDKNLLSVAEQVIILLKSGETLDKSLEKLSFHPIITTYLYFAKEHANLEANLNKCLHIYEQRLNHLKKFTQVIRYPIILIIIFSMVFFFIQHKVLPNLLSLFQQNNQESHMINTTITFSSLIYYGFIMVILISLTIYFLWTHMKPKTPVELQIKLYNMLPIYRGYVKLNTSFLFSTHVETLLKTGLPIKDVLTILSKQTKLPLLSYYATQLINGLNQGFPISLIMEQLTFLSPQLTSIFQKNSNSESLEKDLATYSTFLIDELNDKIVNIITYIQPVFFILLGLIIILIYLSLMLPMYQFINTI
ncbi:competence type IV pilus assembly protein ComGB [Ornithinibacillus sp. 179-J 7C1 HS]|uniref:competence type IV pilus assembly protein ComGB n=1 Tax=Ornithinibacillus sp. 179-J 7C1 HS TaxID=3142384 RepID=UPI0039A35A2D